MKTPPAPMLVVQDLLFFAAVGLGHGTGLWAAAWVVGQLMGLGVPALLTAPVAAAVYPLVTVLAVGLLDRLVPAVPAGKHPLQSRAFLWWGLHLVLYRALRIPPCNWLIRYSNVLRFVWLRMLRTDAAFSSQLSGDVNLLDHHPVTLGPGCVVGSEAMISTHLVLKGMLWAAPVEIGAGALVSARVGLMPGARVGEGAAVHVDAALGPSVVVGARARVGFGAVLDEGVVVGEGAVVEPRSYLPPGTVVPAGERWGGDPAVHVGAARGAAAAPPHATQPEGGVTRT
jgi:acetyltransferase-like isoleucine patch superfamily enzyme